MQEQETVRQWMIHDNGQQLGPYLKSEIATMLVEGRISRSAQAWREGMPAWVPLAGVVPPQVGTPSPAYAPPNVNPPPSNAFCRNCGKAVDPRAIACMSCGLAPMNGNNFCPCCGANTHTQAIVCIKCGVSTQVRPSTASYPSAAGYRNSSQSSSRVAAGICGILLGSLGIHKFIMGYTQAGVIMLVVTVVGACLYGLGPIVMATIGLVEGIIYLTKTDAQFHQEYVVNKKEWF